MTKYEMGQRLTALARENDQLRAALAESQATNDALRAQLGRGSMTRHEELAAAREEAMRTGRVVRA